MRYLLVLVPLVIISCSPFGFNPMGYEILHEDLDTAWKKVSAMEYLAEPEGEDYWKSPKEFFDDGGGDCEDFAIALIYLLGDKATLAVVNRNYDIHALVFYNASALEPILPGQRYMQDIFPVLYTMSYQDIMAYSTSHGRKKL